MKVCIAEKPSVAKNIADVLGATRRKDGYFEGNGYQVTWTFGHLCELKAPEDYSVDWKRWRMEFLPLIPPKFGIRLKNDNGIHKQFSIISNLFAQAEEIINCGDAGQEGELIQRWVFQKTNCKCPVKRLWISSLTEEAIREGFQHLQPSENFLHLYEAGLCRAIGDWLLGMNATRLYTLRFGSAKQILSIGRVQTPTLALIVYRQLEISNFKPEPYWELKTEYRNTIFSVTSGKFLKKEDAQSALNQIFEAPFVVTNIENKKGIETSPKLFDLTSLQVECNKKYGFSAEETLQLIQSLYEKKFTTYPRVDTTFLSDDIYPKVPNILRGISKIYPQLTQSLVDVKLPKSKKVFDNKKVTDHHAIIPTGVVPDSLSDAEKKVYDLVARRFISAFYPECKISMTTVFGKVDNIEFKTIGKQILDQGWRKVWNKQEQVTNAESVEEKILPTFIKGETGPHVPDLQEKKTTPPKPYTEATLLRAMETAGKYVEDEELRDALKENGIGRPSTRAAIIETLFRRNYIVKEHKNLVATKVGIKLIKTIRDEKLKSASLTGVWEKKLREIDRGTYDAKQFIEELKNHVVKIVSNGKRIL